MEDQASVRGKNPRKTGRLGELLTMYLLEEADIECYLVDRKGVDLICMSPTGELFTVQVKAANLRDTRNTRARTPAYIFNVGGPKTSDYYVFLALDIQRIIVMRGKDVKVKSTLKIDMSKFTQKAHMNSLNALVTLKHTPKMGTRPQV